MLVFEERIGLNPYSQRVGRRDMPCARRERDPSEGLSKFRTALSFAHKLHVISGSRIVYGDVNSFAFINITSCLLGCGSY